MPGARARLNIDPSWLACLALLTGTASAATGHCKLPREIGARELNDMLALRAVQVVQRAANPGDALSDLVAPSAEFSAGGGDVGMPLGKGVVGARRLAEEAQADSYRFLGWDYMDMPEEGCARHEIKVEFINTAAASRLEVTFVFEGGRVVSAKGWRRSFKTGPIRSVPGA